MSKPSEVRGAEAPPLIEDTIGERLAAAAERWPDREAVVVRHQGLRLTYAELVRRADAVAAGLLALGLRPGDRVGIWSPNTIEWVLTLFASARAGLILVTVNPAYRVSELEHALRLSGCRALVSAVAFKSSDYLGMLRTLLPELAQAGSGPVRGDRLPDLRWIVQTGEEVQDGMLRFADLAALGGAAERDLLARIAQGLDARDPVNLQFTSGTTGLPKAATLTHRNILNNAWFVAEAMGMRAGDRLCIPVPLYHCFGLVMSVLACMVKGATMVFPSAGFEPAAVLQAVAAERCTLLHGVPTMFIAELGHADFAATDLSTLRGGIMAGATCPVELMRQVMERMNMREITIAYGMTETSPVSFQSAIDDEIERRVATVGRIQPHLEARVVDGSGAVVPRGARGELHVRGYSVMKGYWSEPQRTAEVLDSEGWMHTGDLAEIDDEGYCRIVGRSKDMLIRGGENIYPREIEEFLHRHPGIESAQAFGVPDAKYGEELCVWIRARDGHHVTEEEVREFCREQIAHFKVPRYVVFVEEFPMTVTGKVQKFVMREAMIERLMVVEGEAGKPRDWSKP
jgi:fatty-acyl-CoA synthase